VAVIDTAAAAAVAVEVTYCRNVLACLCRGLKEEQVILQREPLSFFTSNLTLGVQITYKSSNRSVECCHWVLGAAALIVIVGVVAEWHSIHLFPTNTITTFCTEIRISSSQLLINLNDSRLVMSYTRSAPCDPR
jgi:hypothetical protein